MNAKQAIDTLEYISSELDKVANSPENYNSDWAYYLEQMSWQIYKYANELRVLEYKLVLSHSKNIEAVQ